VALHLPGDFEQQVLLAVWRLGADAYGASVRDELEARTGAEVAQGAVYVTLVRLEKKGFLKSRLSDPTPVRGGKAKRIFRITPEGIDGVRETRRLMDRLWDGLPDPDDPPQGA
jgi:DNA-binding PadR family transcriptional regulator